MEGWDALNNHQSPKYCIEKNLKSTQLLYQQVASIQVVERSIDIDNPSFFLAVCSNTHDILVSIIWCIANSINVKSLLMLCVMWHHRCHQCASHQTSWHEIFLCVKSKTCHAVIQCKYLVHMSFSTVVVIGLHHSVPLVMLTSSLIFA